MQLLSFVLAAVAFAAVEARPAPVQKRIAQTIADSTTEWVAACTKAGGAGQCNTISQTAFTSLLAAGGNCDQQDAADQMIDLAKTLNNDPDMIRLAQIFVQQPRNAPDSLQVPYCQTAPKNAELDGLFHCQFSSSDFTKFSGDQTGNLPLGLSAVSPPGSCPAKIDGPVPDGVQLDTLVSSPGTPEGGSGVAAAPASTDAVAATSATAADVASTAAAAADNAGAGAAAAGTTPAAAAASPAADAKPFTLQNGQEAQAQNAQFAALTATSSCTDGQQACVDGAFAQCVSGAFQSTACAGGTQCFALPLVNKAGTSVTCTTEADATARIAATGAIGGITGAAARVRRASFTLQNGKDAQALNAQFASLTASSSCTNGQQACVNGAFAQCVGSSFETTACAGGTQCFALPLVNKAGTSITCSTESDAASRIADTGATGGITGGTAAAAPVAAATTPAAADNAAAAPAAAATTAAAAAAAAPAGAKPFTLQNGKDAQALNAQFASLTASSSCTSGQQACVNGAFAQCVGSTFETTACAGGTQCFALPLVNKAGTSITCTTESDATSRIADTGATGGITGA